MLDFINDLAEEYIQAIRWLKPRLNDYRKLDDIDRIVFFNIWIISFFVFKNNGGGYISTLNCVSAFIKNIDYILEENNNFIYDGIYNNSKRYKIKKDGEFVTYVKPFELCLKLLKKTKYDRDYLDIVNRYILNEKYKQCLNIDLCSLIFKLHIE